MKCKGRRTEKEEEMKKRKVIYGGNGLTENVGVLSADRVLAGRHSLLLSGCHAREVEREGNDVSEQLGYLHA